MTWTPIVWLGWLAIFAILEVPAALHLNVPWKTLSDFLWGLESGDAWLRWVFLILGGIIVIHIVTGRPS